MAKDPTCLVCQKIMEPGFITDIGHINTLHVPRWSPGKPEPSFWTGEVKYHQHKEGLKIVAYRCPECQALRLYAPATT